jgi:hypothetical protein
MLNLADPVHLINGAVDPDERKQHQPGNQYRYTQKKYYQRRHFLFDSKIHNRATPP